MTRPMPESDRQKMWLRLHGRRFELFAMVTKWLRFLEYHIPIAWDEATHDKWRDMVLQEMGRRENRLPVRCLCEEDFVVETVWRLVSNDADRKAVDARYAALAAQIDALKEQTAALTARLAEPGEEPQP